MADVPATLVLFESPNRIAALLEDARDTLGDRDAALCRELTKLHETFDRARLSELACRYAGAGVKGEIVLVIAPPGAAAAPAEADVEQALRQALATATVKEAAQSVAAATGLPRRELYRRALALKGGR
jgi:16S rRNA (cytidine1402-2'-O)-methyltransferase